MKKKFWLKRLFKSKLRLFWINFLIIVLIIFFDQLTKFWAKHIAQPISLLPFLQLNLIRNTGAGFGLFQNKNLLLAFITIILVFLLISGYRYTKNKQSLYLSLIIGGAFGNLIDRLFFGSVVDFVDLSFWPAFNLADSAITIGAILLALDLILKWSGEGERKNKKEKINKQKKKTRKQEKKEIEER